MKNTLVIPIDFSSSSLNAASYAVAFAKTNGSVVVLLHVCMLPVMGAMAVSAELIDNWLEDAEKRMAELKQNLQYKTGNSLTIISEVKTGTVFGQLKDYCASVQQPVVIMGAHITGAAERMIFGSNILTAMRNLACPLIVVPDGTKFTNINIAAIACDLRNAARAIHAEELIKLLNDFEVQLHIIHVTSKKHGMLDEEEIAGSEYLRATFKNFNPVFHYLQNDNIEQAIAGFAEQNRLNLLVIIPKKHGLFNRLLHKSQSKQMIINSRIPLMSIHE